MGPGACPYLPPVAPRGSHGRGNRPPFYLFSFSSHGHCSKGLVRPSFSKILGPWMPSPWPRRSGENVRTSPMNAGPGVVCCRTLCPHTDPTNGESHPQVDNFIVFRTLPCLVWPVFLKVPRPWIPPPCGRQGKTCARPLWMRARRCCFPDAVASQNFWEAG